MHESVPDPKQALVKNCNIHRTSLPDVLPTQVRRLSDSRFCGFNHGDGASYGSFNRQVRRIDQNSIIRRFHWGFSAVSIARIAFFYFGQYLFRRDISALSRQLLISSVRPTFRAGRDI